MVEQTFSAQSVAQFISDEVTAGAAIARKAMMKNIAKAGSVTEKKLQYLVDGVIRDMILVKSIEKMEFPLGMVVPIPEVMMESEDDQQVELLTEADPVLVTKPKKSKKTPSKKDVEPDQEENLIEG